MFSQSAIMVELWPELSSGLWTAWFAMFPHREEWAGQLSGIPKVTHLILEGLSLRIISWRPHFFIPPSW